MAGGPKNKTAVIPEIQGKVLQSARQSLAQKLVYLKNILFSWKRVGFQAFILRLTK